MLKQLQAILSYLGKGASIAYTAPTGVAACNIGGLTIHSWSGLGVMDPVSERERAIAKAFGTKETRKRWTSTDILVIDEISMVSGPFFDCLSAIGKRCRQSDAPFGGIQLILTGDFFQLPPIGHVPL